jgi:Zn-dependent protease
MRDPMAWALPVFRAFGIQVRVHLFFFLITLGICGRTLYEGSFVSPLDVVLFTIVVLFGSILLHEFGHCFGGRYVGGEAEEILIWPLGGLAFVSVPRNWKAHTFMVAAGPFTNVLICFVMGLGIAGAGYLPTLSPIYDPYICEIHNYRDGRTYTSEYGLKLYEPDKDGVASSATPGYPTRGKPEALNEIALKSNLDRALAPSWVVWFNRIFWLNWVLILFNIIPAFPLDGGQLLLGFIWGRKDYRTGVIVACYSGYVCGAIALLVSIATNETLLTALSLAMLFASYKQLMQMHQDESPFGDFSNGYTSLDQDDDAPPPRKRQSFFKRWMTARAAKRMQRDLAQRQEEDVRMDQLLEKIARSGKASLSDEERRFMERISERYRK